MAEIATSLLRRSISSVWSGGPTWAKDYESNVNDQYKTVELWSIALGRHYFGPNFHLSDIRLSSCIPPPGRPWPLATAVGKTAESSWEWYEFDPTKVRRLCASEAIRTNTFGTVSGAQDNLPSIMGTCGSAMCVSTSYLGLADWVQPFSSPAAEDWEGNLILFKDAGTELGNLPLPPLLEKDRKIDLIIVIEASDGLWSTTETNLELKSVYRWMNQPTRDKNLFATLPPWPNGRDWHVPQLLVSSGGGPSILYLPIASPNLATIFPTANLNPGPAQVEEMTSIMRQQYQRAKPLLVQFLKDLKSRS
eukprot:TRINITY_DN8674_c0_g1_i14.p1 TRINITY_DN8674_c0_g1~~TRINITY_DN8674_c0_g1_i14.p1  ORF type:complete len:306 (+),score=60.04 TRINITY_DN8674_c0_g1_i14:160-1077(+)